MALATHHRTSGSARTAPRQRCFDPAGAPFAFGRTWPSPGPQTGLAQNAGSIHDWVVRRVKTARISLTRTPRFRLAPCVGQNGARPGYRAILHEEFALTTAPCDTQMNTSAFAMVVDSTVIVGSTFENLLMTAPEAKFASDHPCISHFFSRLYENPRILLMG